MSLSLIETLKQVEDFRSARRKRDRLWVVLLLVILGVMSQHQGDCALKAVASRHKDVLNFVIHLLRLGVCLYYSGLESDRSRHSPAFTPHTIN